MCQRSNIDVLTYEDRCVDLRGSMLKILILKLYEHCAEGLHFSAFIIYILFFIIMIIIIIIIINIIMPAVFFS